MMMDAVVQLVRNFLCCVKDLQLFSSTFLYDVKLVAHNPYYNFPPPLNETTLLEVLIGATQFYAFASCTRSGFLMMMTSLGKFHRIQRLLEQRQEQKNSSSTSSSSTTTMADRLLNESLLKEGSLALRSLFIGLNVMFIGLSFFWLFANSWHVTDTDWIGGLQGLIHALTVMEICLVPLLYYMWTDGTAQLTKALELEALAHRVAAEAASTTSPKKSSSPSVSSSSLSPVTLSELEMLTDWKPFWSEGIPLSELAAVEEPTTKTENEKDKAAKPSSSSEQSRVLEETTRIHELLKPLVVVHASTWDDFKEKESKLQRQMLLEKSQHLHSLASVAKWEGYREFVYFLLNFVAFYGYLLGILAYYYEDDTDSSNTTTKASTTNSPAAAVVVRHLKLGMTNAKADWRGNFAGDLMWTLEPVVILLTPLLFRHWNNKNQKQQQQPQQSSKEKEEQQKSKAD